jgi:hypothetical protein
MVKMVYIDYKDMPYIAFLAFPTAETIFLGYQLMVTKKQLKNANTPCAVA